jgi:hypothetical protein
MVVREEVQRHRGIFLEKAIEGWIVGGSRNVVAVTGPNGRFGVSGRGDCKDDWL